jgi:hypothetical protein
MHIEYGIHGGRTVVAERNGELVVTTGRHGGYVQRAYLTRGGKSYYSRTYYHHGILRTEVYRGYGWNGHLYYGYNPDIWYHPGFYRWADNTWPGPVAWGIGDWGWGGAPWWGFYGGWWSPYPIYVAPYYWLTDYVFASDLQEAYSARIESGATAAAAAADDQAANGDAPAASSQITLSPEVKDEIAQEVKAQLASEQAQTHQSGSSAAPANTQVQVPPPALDPSLRTFVVDSNITVASNGQECELTGGDVLTRITDSPDADQTVPAIVSSSKRSDCPPGKTVAVKVNDLQEMYNHFEEQLTNGMSELAKKQGTGGLPKAPDTETISSDVPAPPPDKAAAKTMEDQQRLADQIEAEVRQELSAAKLSAHPQ